MNNTDNFTKKDTLAIKALAVMLMIIHHLFAFPDKFSEGVSLNNLIILSDGSPLSEIAGNYGKLCVALFMMLSGYGLYISHKNSDGNVTATVLKRIKVVYIKYWQVFFVMIPLGIIIGVEKVSVSWSTMLKNFLAIETTVNDEWWFMTLYVIMLFLFPIIITWVDRKNANFLKDFVYLLLFNTFVNTALLTFTQTNAYMASFNGTYFWQKMSVALVMLPMFAIGCLLAKYDVISLVLKKVTDRLFRIFLGIGLLILTITLRQSWAMRSNWGWDRLDYIYAAIFTIAFTLILYNTKKIKDVLAFIGAQSTGIWLIHTFLCYYYFHEVFFAVKFPILVFLLTFSVSLLLSWVISYVCHRVWSIFSKIS